MKNFAQESLLTSSYISGAAQNASRKTERYVRLCFRMPQLHGLLGGAGSPLRGGTRPQPAPIIEIRCVGCWRKLLASLKQQRRNPWEHRPAHFVHFLLLVLVLAMYPVQGCRSEFRHMICCGQNCFIFWCGILTALSLWCRCLLCRLRSLLTNLHDQLFPTAFQQTSSSYLLTQAAVLAAMGCHSLRWVPLVGSSVLTFAVLRAFSCWPCFCQATLRLATASSHKMQMKRPWEWRPSDHFQVLSSCWPISLVWGMAAGLVFERGFGGSMVQWFWGRYNFAGPCCSSLMQSAKDARKWIMGHHWWQSSYLPSAANVWPAKVLAFKRVVVQSMVKLCRVALCSFRTWQDMQTFLLGQPTRSSQSTRESTQLLAGFARCGTCVPRSLDRLTTSYQCQEAWWWRGCILLMMPRSLISKPKDSLQNHTLCWWQRSSWVEHEHSYQRQYQGCVYVCLCEGVPVIARARVQTTSRLLAGGTGAKSYNMTYHFGPLTDGSKAAESMRIPSTLDRLVNGWTMQGARFC